MVLNRALPDVPCPKCVHKGGLAIYVEYVSSVTGDYRNGGSTMKLSVRTVPVMSCSRFRCKMILVGYIDNGDAVFPDPHVQALGS